MAKAASIGSTPKCRTSRLPPTVQSVEKEPLLVRELNSDEKQYLIMNTLQYCKYSQYQSYNISAKNYGYDILKIVELKR